MVKAVLLAAALAGCAASYNAHTSRPAPVWTQAVDFALGGLAAAASVHQFNEGDGLRTLSFVVVAEAFWWTAALTESR